MLTTANGQRVKGKGEFCVDATTAEGHKTKTRFVDADVDMPIMSVSQICEGGSEGSDVVFDDLGGTITDRKSGRKTRFIERQGVYFLALMVRRSPDDSDGSDMDFVRPVAHP